MASTPERDATLAARQAKRAKRLKNETESAREQKKSDYRAAKAQKAS